MEFVTKLVEGKFPDYNRVIPKNHKNSITLGRDALLKTLAAHGHLDQRQIQGRAPEH
jgi:DNA polymerase-3 subunit beta